MLFEGCEVRTGVGSEDLPVWHRVFLPLESLSAALWGPGPPWRVVGLGRCWSRASGRLPGPGDRGWVGIEPLGHQAGSRYRARYSSGRGW